MVFTGELWLILLDCIYRSMWSAVRIYVLFEYYNCTAIKCGRNNQNKYTYSFVLNSQKMYSQSQISWAGLLEVSSCWKPSYCVQVCIGLGPVQLCVSLRIATPQHARSAWPLMLKKIVFIVVCLDFFFFGALLFIFFKIEFQFVFCLLPFKTCSEKSLDLSSAHPPKGDL